MTEIIDDLTISYEEFVSSLTDERLLDEYALLAAKEFPEQSHTYVTCKKEILKRMEEGEAFDMERNIDLHKCQATNRRLIELVCEVCRHVPWSLAQMGRCDECTRLEPPAEEREVDD